MKAYCSSARVRFAVASALIGVVAVVSLTGCGIARRLLGRSGGGSEAAGAASPREMDAQAGELATIEGAAIERVGSEIKITWDTAVLFDFDSAMLATDSQDVIKRMADVFVRHPNTHIVIAAHTDSVGPDDYNQKLSARRASSLRDYLVDLGVAPSRLRAEGRGELFPVAGNDTEEGRRLNRRVEISVSAKEN